jgi:hypothetical protein
MRQLNLACNTILDLTCPFQLLLSQRDVVVG